MPRKETYPLPRCSWHKPKTLGFMQDFADAERRIERGEHQWQCGECFLWFWPDLWGDPKKKPIMISDQPCARGEITS